MKIGDTVNSIINRKVYVKLYSNVVIKSLNNYKNTILYNNALTVLMIQPNYREYDFRGKY
jgi:hypothetical protein